MNKHTLVLQDSFTLESGAELKKPQVVYHTDGQLNEAKDNVILVVHALSANSEVRDWWDGLYGEGNVFDPERYFIICINNLGSPYGTVSAISENPTTGEPYGADFPFFTIRDTARLHMRVLHELGLDQIDTLIGPSCGGNIAQEMSIDLGEDVKNLILICCSSQETPWVIAVHEAGRQALKADPTFLSSQDGGREGLKAARALAIPFYRSAISFKIRQSEQDVSVISDFKAASYIRYQGEKFVKRFDPYAYYSLLTALDTHNIGRDRINVPNALGMIKAKTLSMAFKTDVLITPDEQRYLAEHIPNGQFVEIDSIYGHDSFLIATDQMKEEIFKFLGEDR